MSDKNFLDKALDAAEEFMDKVETRHDEYVEAHLQQWWRAVRSELPYKGHMRTLGPVVWHAFQKGIEPLCGTTYHESTDLVLSDAGGQILVCQSCLYRSGAR